MVLALGSCTKNTYRMAQGGGITYQSLTEPKLVIDTLMDKVQNMMSILFCVSRIMEAQAWAKLRSKEDPMYKEAMHLKQPLDPAEPMQLTDKQKQSIKPYLQQITTTHAQGSADGAAADVPEAQGWELGEFLEMEEELEEHGEMHLPRVCTMCKARPPTTVCKQCFEDRCKPCARAGCSECGME